MSGAALGIRLGDDLVNRGLCRVAAGERRVVREIVEDLVAGEDVRVWFRRGEDLVKYALMILGS